MKPLIDPQLYLILGLNINQFCKKELVLFEVIDNLLEVI